MQVVAAFLADRDGNVDICILLATISRSPAWTSACRFHCWSWKSCSIQRDCALVPYFIVMLFCQVLQSTFTVALVHSRTNTLEPGEVSLHILSTGSPAFAARTIAQASPA
jgi:hypothetical protein